MPRSLTMIYATTTGHTEYVIDTLQSFLKEKEPGMSVTAKRAEEATADDCTKADLLLLASGTWNTGGREGQLNPHMGLFLGKRAKDVDLAGKECLIVSLGDARYRETARATEHLGKFIRDHKGKILPPPLVIINDPEGQEEQIKKWGEKLFLKLSQPSNPQTLKPSLP